MNLPSLVEVVNKNALLITKLIEEEIDQVDTERRLNIDDRLYALAMFYRAAILDFETKAAGMKQ